MSEENKKSKKNRSAAYPAISLEEAILAIRDIKNKLGKDKYNRKKMSEALGHTSEAGAVRKIAALVHYGLVKREGNVYSYENIVDKILLPTSEEEKSQALIEAVSHPTLFNGLINKYEGQSLPTMLDSILVRDFNINENYVKEVADDFKASIEYAGIYKNGVLSKSIILSNGEVDEVGQEEDKIDDKKNNTKTDVRLVNNNVTQETVSLELPSGLIIIYPKKLSFNFSMGDFADVIKKLDEAVKKKLNEENK